MMNEAGSGKELFVPRSPTFSGMRPARMDTLKRLSKIEFNGVRGTQNYVSFIHSELPSVLKHQSGEGVQ
jgi:hypothetical protein